MCFPMRLGMGSDTGRRLQWINEQIYHLWDSPTWETPALFIGVPGQRQWDVSRSPPLLSSASPLILGLWGCRGSPNLGFLSSCLLPVVPCASLQQAWHTSHPGVLPQPLGTVQGLSRGASAPAHNKILLSWPCSGNISKLEPGFSATIALVLGQSFHAGP